MNRVYSITFSSMLLFVNICSVQGSIVLNTADAVYTQTAAPPSGSGINASVIIKQIPPEYISGANSTFLSALSSQFPGWTFNNGGGLNGELKIKRYEAAATTTYGGAIFDLTYTRALSDPSLANLHWVQLISTNVPISVNAPNNYIDPFYDEFESPQLPFYYSPISTDVGFHEDSHKNSLTQEYSFYDYPKRNYPAPPANFFTPATGVTWQADLVLASWDNQLTNGVGTITLYDGLRWGFIIQRYPNSIASNYGSVAMSDRVMVVPEPSSWIIALPGIIVGAYFKKRGKK